MISGIVPFEEIVQSVKDETGIENLRPFYEKIKRLIFRAEKDIGYGGSVELMKKTYLIAGITNIDPNFGKFLKFPQDLIELEGIGQDCKAIVENKYRPTAEGIRFCEKQTKDTVLLYWGINTDDNGYPMVTRSHEDAVVAYIVWKLYTSRVFLGIGNMNAKQDYERAYTTECLAARGDDAFPTLEQWNALGQLSYTDRRTLIDQNVHSYDYCAEYEDELVEEEVVVPPSEQNIYYWVHDSLSDDIIQIIPLITPTYLLGKNFKTAEVFKNLVVMDNLASSPGAAIGRIVFAVTSAHDAGFMILDAFNNNISHLFNPYHDYETDIKIYVSQSVYSYFSLGFKIQPL